MKYAFDVNKVRVDKHEFYSVESKCIKGCVAQGDTLEEALSLFEEIEKECIDAANKYNIPILEDPTADLNEYSGKLLLRMPKSLHKRIAENATKEGVSINQLAVSALSEHIGYIEGVNDTIKSYRAKLVEKACSIMTSSRFSESNPLI